MYNVQCYDLVTEGEQHITPHFKVKEFACSDGSRVVFISLDLVNLEESARVHFGRPMHNNSGYRTVSYNQTVKSSSANSKHTYGLAVDCWAEGVSVADLYSFFDKALGDHGGVIIYDSFVHVDMRADKYRGDSRTKKG